MATFREILDASQRPGAPVADTAVAPDQQPAPELQFAPPAQPDQTEVPEEPAAADALDEPAAADAPSQIRPTRGPASRPAAADQPAAPQAEPDFRARLESAGADASSQVETLAKAAVSGVAVGSGASAGLALGMAAGSPLAPATAGVSIALGGLIGLTIGGLAGTMADEELQNVGLSVNVESLADEERPLAISIRDFFAGLPFTGGTMAAARYGGRVASGRIGNFVNNTLDYAAKHPIRFAMAETSALISSATATGLYEVIRPGHPFERAAVGIAGGVASVPVMAVRTGTFIANGLRKLVLATGLSQGARRSAASAELARILEKAGGDADAILTMLDDAQALAERIPGFDPTAAMSIDSDAVRRIESNLAEIDRTFGSDRGLIVQRARQALANVIVALEKTGDPEALKMASDARMQRYAITLDRVAAYAELEAQQAAQNIAGRGPAASEAARTQQMADISEAGFKIYDRQVELARNVETELWEAAAGGRDAAGRFSAQRRLLNMLSGEATELIPVPSDVAARMASVQKSLDTIARSEAGEALEGGVEITEKMLADASNDVSVGKMLDFRRDLLRLARGQARSTDPKADSLGRVYGLMAEAVLDDLTAAGAATKLSQAGPRGITVRRGQGGQFTSLPTAFDEARAYSAALNDTMIRSFGGKAAQETAFGYGVPPETMMRRAFATGGEAALHRANDLTDAVSFLPDIVKETSPQLAAVMQENAAAYMDLTARYLRLMADETRAFTGEASVKSLRGFMDKHGALIAKFPAVKADLEAAVSTQARFDEWTKRITGIKRDLEKKAFGKIAGTDSPVDFVRGAMGGRTAVSALDNLHTTAKLSGPEAVDGFAASIWEAVMAKGQVGTDEASLERLIGAITNPMRAGLPSPLQYMVSRGLISAEDTAFLDDIIRLDGFLKKAQDPFVATGEEVVKAPNMFTNIIVRMVGSGLARKALEVGKTVIPALEGGTAQSLIVGTAGSSVAQKLFERMPRASVQTLLVNALKGDPLNPNGERFSLLRELAKPIVTAQQQAQVAGRVYSYLWMNGLVGAHDILGAEEETPTNTLPPFSKDAFPRSPAAVKQEDDTAAALFESDISQRDERELPELAQVLRASGAEVPAAPAASNTNAATSMEGRSEFNLPAGTSVPGLTRAEVSLIAADLRRMEGFRSVADNKDGNWTIGYGENLSAQSKEPITAGDVKDMRFTPQEANARMISRVAQMSAELSQRLKFWGKLSTNQRRALVNMSYQNGVQGVVVGFKDMIAALARGDTKEAVREALDSDWARTFKTRAAQVTAMLGDDAAETR